MERIRLEQQSNVICAALNSAANGVIITDRKGSIQYANPAFLRMFDYETESGVTGKSAAELFASQGSRRFADLKAVMDKSKGDTEEVQVFRRDGSLFHVEVSTSGITDSEGHDVGRMASFVDITDRKQIANALKESSEKNKTLCLFGFARS